jgi:hypothetical protein
MTSSSIASSSAATHTPEPVLVSISALEAEIDRLVYQLYGLTAEEITLVEGKK